MTKSQISNAQLAMEFIQQQMGEIKPQVGIVLGSGLSHFANQLQDKIIIDYKHLPGFPTPSVHGHPGCLVLGYLAGVPVVCLQGRSHAYEGNGYEPVKTYVRTLKLLGCRYFLATNASGSLRKEVAPGELMLITDHINFQPGNPLVGNNDEEFGPRFLPMDNAYDKTLQEVCRQVAIREKIDLYEGVYIAVLGPNYETAAEIKAFGLLGADAVGMSTVPEVLVAHHCGMKVGVIATITNYATGLDNTIHDHQQVVKTAARTTEKLSHLLACVIAELK